MVYTANFYADRSPKHAQGFYKDDLMVRVPKNEYVFGTRSRQAKRHRSGSMSAKSTSARSSACASTACLPQRGTEIGESDVTERKATTP